MSGDRKPLWDKLRTTQSTRYTSDMRAALGLDGSDTEEDGREKLPKSAMPAAPPPGSSRLPLGKAAALGHAPSVAAEGKRQLLRGTSQRILASFLESLDPTQETEQRTPLDLSSSPPGRTPLSPEPQVQPRQSNALLFAASRFSANGAATPTPRPGTVTLQDVLAAPPPSAVPALPPATREQLLTRAMSSRVMMEDRPARYSSPVNAMRAMHEVRIHPSARPVGSNPLNTHALNHIVIILLLTFNSYRRSTGPVCPMRRTTLSCSVRGPQLWTTRTRATPGASSPSR